jgi:hypothetical protein
MAISVTHDTVVVVADDGTSPVGSDEWNAAHTVTGAVADTITITSGDGLTGGGDLSTNRTLAVGAGTGITVNADDVALDITHARNALHPTSTDNAIARYDGTTGALQNSAPTIDDSGNIAVPSGGLFGLLDAKVTVFSSGSERNLNLIGYDVSGFGGPTIRLMYTKAASPATQTAVASGDFLGGPEWYGSDGTNYITAAAIYCSVDGAVSTNDMPGRLTFWTTADGAASATERMRITSAGQIVIASGGTIELGHDTDTTLSRAAAGALAVEGVRVAMTGKQCVPVR